MGAAIGLVVVGLWFASGVALLERGVHRDAPALIAACFAVRAYLTTGLFITAHDAMHGSVSRTPWLNGLIGRVACFSFAAMSYARLVRNHRLHHASPATVGDPDYAATRSFAAWFLRFMARYTTATQLVAMAAIYNILHLRYDDASLWLYWAGPSLAASLQLFYFGTYRPHVGPHDAQMGPHRARTLPSGHARAMLSCYFFGYHREHHESPRTPWWALWTLKSPARRPGCDIS